MKRKLSPLGPAFGIAMGKWYAPLGVRGGLFAGFHKTLSDDQTYTLKEGYIGGRLEGLLNLNRLFNHHVTDPRLEANLFGGYELGFLAHRGEKYDRKVRPFHGPTAGAQLVYAVNSRIGVFGQARWSKSLYTQSFKNSAYVEDRFMQNLGIELGVQYRRRTEDITNKYLFTPYNFVSVAVGASLPYPHRGSAGEADDEAPGTAVECELRTPLEPLFECERYGGNGTSALCRRTTYLSADVGRGLYG